MASPHPPHDLPVTTADLLLQHVIDNGPTTATKSELSQLLDRSERSVQYAIRNLEAFGFIVVTRTRTAAECPSGQRIEASPAVVL